MNITVNARHMDVTDSLRDYISTKVEKLPKLYDGVKTIEVVLTREGDRSVVEIIVQARKKHTFVASDQGHDTYACVDTVLDKIATQLRRHKERVRDRQGPGLNQAVIESVEEPGL